MRRTYVAVFLLALTSLATEVLLTRIFDVLLWHNLSFMIISCAVFGLALGGLRDVVAPPSGSGLRAARLHWLALAFAASVWAIPLLLNAIPFSVDDSSRRLLVQMGWFFTLYVVLLTPFFFMGWCLCRIFTLAPRHIQRLYGVDLAGAALGALLLFPLLQPLGPSRLLWCASLLAIGAALALSPSARSARAIAAFGLVLFVAPDLLGSRYLTLALHDDKRHTKSEIEDGRLEVSTWDPISQIAVLDQPPETTVPADRGRKHIAYDGGSQTSTFYPFDGDFAALRADLPRQVTFQFWRRAVLAAHYLKRDTGHQALIIGSAGGQETKAALMYGAARIDAVEMVGTIVRLATGPYADYIGRLYDRPGVRLHVAEGRSFLRASGRQYDVIQVFSNYTTSSVANGSGALTPTYLVTAEAFGEYFTHLAPDGIVQINYLFYPRLVATAAAAWRASGRSEFRSHVAVVHHANQPDYLPTILIKMTRWTPGELADLQAFFSFPAIRELPYRLVENPLDRAASFLPDEFFSGDPPAEFVEMVPYDVRPATDDRPFSRMLRTSARPLHPDAETGVDVTTAHALNTRLYKGWLPKDWLHIIGAGAASIFFGLLFVVVPIACSRLGRAREARPAPLLIYFSLLGFAFMTLELVFIQVFTKLIGYPLYSMATVIVVMLVAAALGSLFSARIAGEDGARWGTAFAGLLAAGVVMWLAYPAVTTAFMTAPLPVRIAATAALIGPVGFFMGIPFPLGLVVLASRPRGAVAWAWSMNGLFTTIGGVASALLSLALGFRLTILVAIGLYALAAVAFAWLRQTSAAPAAVPARGREPLVANPSS
jgi:spermidine synthase